MVFLLKAIPKMEMHIIKIQVLFIRRSIIITNF